jgi:hypothetical protein
MAWRVSCHGLLAGDEDEDGEWKWRFTGNYAQMCNLFGFLGLGMTALEDALVTTAMTTTTTTTMTMTMTMTEQQC